MRVVISATWTSGEVLPFARLGRRLCERGHSVIFVANAPYADLARELDLDFMAVDTQAAFDEFMADSHLFRRPEGFLTVYDRHVFPHVMREFDALVAAVASGGPGERTVLVSRPTPGIAWRMAGLRTGVPMIAVLPNAQHVSARHLTMELFGSVFAPQIDALHRAAGLPPMGDVDTWYDCAALSMGAWPEWFAPDVKALAPTLHTPGFFLPSSARGSGSSLALPAEAAALVHDSASAGAPILITGGSGRVAGDDFFEAAVAAARHVDRPLLVLTRQRDMARSLPDGVRLLREVPEMASLLREVSLVVHHGGMGSIGDALAAGVPQLVLAHGGDRPENGGRVAKLGVGEVLPLSQWKPEAISAAMKRLIISDDVARACARYASAVRAEDALDEAARLVEFVLPRSAARTTKTHAVDGVAIGAQPAKLLATIAELSPAKRAWLLAALDQEDSDAARIPTTDKSR